VVVQKSVLVGHSAQQMYSLVDAVEAYPQFLPWCDAAKVIHRDDTRTRATLHINYHGAKHSFTTENVKQAPCGMTIKLVEGPFRVLDGEWRFNALSEEACKVEFRLHYEFSSWILEKLVGPVFSYISNTMVDAFVRRADAVYGG
jgi:ribosome-associated toxin RatA of RatAB toxin-antitoxin module